MRAIIIVASLFLAGTADAQERRAHPYVVSSSSMEPTLREGEFVLADRRPDDCGDITGLEPGDIVVRRNHDKPWISRLIAGPGQTLEIRDGVPVIDGESATVEHLGEAARARTSGHLLRETLPNGRTYEILRLDMAPPAGMDAFGPVRLGPEEWFVMGDNRLNAIDSRFEPPVKSSDMCGLLTRIYGSLDPERLGPLR